MAGQDAAQAGRVGDDGAGEPGAVVEVGEPGGCLVGGRAAQVLLVVGGEGEKVFAAPHGLFGLDLGAEAGVAGAGVALDHLDAEVAVLDGSGDDAAGAAGDVPGQGAAELPGGQVPGLAVDLGDRAEAVVMAVGVDPGNHAVIQLVAGAQRHRSGPDALCRVEAAQEQVGGGRLEAFEDGDGAGGRR
ncbi:hypothetical protein ACIHAR_02645 [Streptomyces sp. NPDC052016]|uniref:hypothetical protein n=1 Tax=Streptomyces sp. NPDC052016 TaxID=3365680 RepID=UPI0037D89D95